MQTYKVYANLTTAEDTVPNGSPCRAVLLTAKGNAGNFSLLAANGITFDYSLPQNSSAIVPIATKRILAIPTNGSVSVLN